MMLDSAAFFILILNKKVSSLLISIDDSVCTGFKIEGRDVTTC